MRSFTVKNISALLLLTFGLMVWGSGMVKGQYTKIRATYVGPASTNTGGTSGAGGSPGTVIIGPPAPAGDIGTYSITTPESLNDADYTNSAKLSAISGGPGGGLGGGAGALSTAYINLSFPGLPTSNIGNAIFIKATAVSNSRPIGYEQVTVQAYLGTDKVGLPISLSSMSVNSSGYYVFPPIGVWNSIRIILSTDNGTSLLGLLGGKSTASVDLYDVYSFNPTCNPPTYTTKDVSGVSLGGGVISQDNAIDGDLNSKATLTVGLLTLLGGLKETVYFSKTSAPGDAATITFSVPPAVLNLSLFQGIIVQAYDGVTKVGPEIQVNTLLTLDLLGLLGNGTRYTASYVPSTTAGFNRIEISTTAVATVLNNFYLHEVQQTPAKPVFTNPAIPPNLQTIYTCYGTTATITPVQPITTNELRWYDSQVDGALLFTGNSYTTQTLTSDKTFYVANAQKGCTPESERIPVKVIVNPLPALPDVQPAAICKGTTSLLAIVNPLPTLTYKWYSVATGGSVLKIGETFTTPSLISDTSYYVESIITLTGCASATRKEVKVTVKPLPITPPITIQ